jgi:metal binding Ada-like protein
MPGEDHQDASDAPRPYTLLGSDRRSYRSAEPGTLGGHRGTRIYGRLDCPAALRAIARGGYVRQRVFFRDEETAVAAGFRPCAVCCPQQYQAFKARKAASSDSASSSA